MTEYHSEPIPDIEGAIRLLSTPDVQLRQFIAYLLGQTGDRRAVEPLIQTLADEHVGVRGAAANALGQLGDPQAVPYLWPLLQSDNAQLVIWAAFALTMLGHDQFDVLTSGLEATDVDVRRSAILAMEQLGDTRAIEPLLALRDDDSKRFKTDSTVAEAVERVLYNLGYGDGESP
ncbi:MAG: HEAT repeat domain-containing protein [Chloroflexi bacterium]|nr:MAG: HEAT repeat domain-containing protein [Chloroflexota bacterium]